MATLGEAKAKTFLYGWSLVLRLLFFVQTFVRADAVKAFCKVAVVSQQMQHLRKFRDVFSRMATEASREMAGDARKPPEVDVTFRAEGPGPSLAIRVRQFLKVALRRFGLRAVSINRLEAYEETAEPLPPDATPE